MVVVPALDEAPNVARLVPELLRQPVQAVIVVDNGSSDGTGELAAAAGARVVREPRRGYGYACAAGTATAIADGADVVVYIDADASSRPDEIPRLLAPITAGGADLVVGSRVLGRIEGGSMPSHQRLGNRLAAALMSRMHGVTVTDPGPFRAIRAELIEQVAMTEMTYGWPTEMTVKSLGLGARVVEVPVTWQARQAGRSKVGGTLAGSIRAGWAILRVTVAHRRARPVSR